MTNTSGSANEPTVAARLALVAAVGDLPGWFTPDSPEPARTDCAAREQNQFLWNSHLYLCGGGGGLQDDGQPARHRPLGRHNLAPQHEQSPRKQWIAVDHIVGNVNQDHVYAEWSVFNGSSIEPSQLGSSLPREVGPRSRGSTRRSRGRGAFRPAGLPNTRFREGIK
ncbi:MAG TPA: hypothetical protein VKF14_20790 [Candidatus Dormibacteraeota bacterium]|nr:hypothetical protein [Candidatus Dormibacteraeota bacterium]